MKKLEMFTAMIVCALLAGCANLGSTFGEDSFTFRLEKAATALTQVHLQDNPEDRPEFERVREQLDVLLHQTDPAPVSLNALLAALPLSEKAALYRTMAHVIIGEVKLKESPMELGTFFDLVRALDKGVAAGMPKAGKAK